MSCEPGSARREGAYVFINVSRVGEEWLNKWRRQEVEQGSAALGLAALVDNTGELLLSLPSLAASAPGSWIRGGRSGPWVPGVIVPKAAGTGTGILYWNPSRENVLNVLASTKACSLRAQGHSCFPLSVFLKQRACLRFLVLNLGLGPQPPGSFRDLTDELCVLFLGPLYSE
jgi:hypothetical protein